MDRYKMCLCFSRKFRSREAEAPPEVKRAYSRYADGSGFMSPEQLLRFLVEFQNEPQATISDAEAIVERVRSERHLRKFVKTARLTLSDFYRFLFSPDLNSPLPSQVHQDMTAPLSHYFIYNGHNSYLTGNQLSSDCSDVPIIKALNRGVRVIELDTWPNSKKDDIDIVHGRTLMTPVELIKCLKSIREHAFVASPYPVILTLEDHLTPDLQAKAAEMITQTFGEMLFCPEAECLEELPSPEALKNRVLVSTKPPKEYLQLKEFKESDLDKDEAWGRKVLDPKAQLQANIKKEHDSKEHDSVESSDDDSDTDDGESKVQQNTVRQYKRFIAITAAKRVGGLKNMLSVENVEVRRISLNEQALEKATISHGADLVRFTQKNFLRVFPKATRFDSSNYNPFIGWMHGAQMVAFNMQGYGRSLWLMQGLFRGNGECGYVKKPDFLMNTGSDNAAFDPMEKLPVKKTLKVKVFMGDGWRLDFSQTHFDTYSPPDFYTRVGIAGVPADTVMKKTRIIEDNWVPVWNEEFIFPLTVPELALLRIEVHEYDMSEKDDFGGQTCLPVSELKYGIRTVPLFDRKGEEFKSVKLLMQLEFV